MLMWIIRLVTTMYVMLWIPNGKVELVLRELIALI